MKVSGAAQARAGMIAEIRCFVIRIGKGASEQGLHASAEEHWRSRARSAIATILKN
jgi:hypothetical protein